MNTKDTILVAAGLLVGAIGGVVAPKIFIHEPTISVVATSDTTTAVTSASTTPESRVPTLSEPKYYPNAPVFSHNLRSGYLVDKDYVYYQGNVVESAKGGPVSPSSFMVLTGNLEPMPGAFIRYSYAKDGTMVYYNGVALGGGNGEISPAAFRPIENGTGYHSYGTDGRFVYYRFRRIYGADPKTFKILWRTAYEGSASANYSEDSTHVYYSDEHYDTAVPDADPETFEALCWGYGRDKSGFYKGIKYVGQTVSVDEWTCTIG